MIDDLFTVHRDDPGIANVNTMVSKLHRCAFILYICHGAGLTLIHWYVQKTSFHLYTSINKKSYYWKFRKWHTSIITICRDRHKRCILSLLSAASGCPPGRYECATEARCIPNDWLCNFNEECAGGDDEMNCPTPDPGVYMGRKNMYNFGLELKRHVCCISPQGYAVRHIIWALCPWWASRM